jgi:hypothetical protein
MVIVPLVPAPPQSCPSAKPQFAGPGGGLRAHVPRVWPAFTTHVPVQQPALTEHASPGCPQNDDDWHVPLLAQKREQHCAAEVQGLPIVEHVELRAVHLPPVHVWLQQTPLAAHATPSGVHEGYWQV